MTSSRTLTDDLMNFGDLQHALRNLLQRGMRDPQGQRMQGLRDLLQQLRQQRRQQLDRFNLSSAFDDIQKKLEKILERSATPSIAGWRTPATAAAPTRRTTTAPPATPSNRIATPCSAPSAKHSKQRAQRPPPSRAKAQQGDSPEGAQSGQQGSRGSGQPGGAPSSQGQRRVRPGRVRPRRVRRHAAATSPSASATSSRTCPNDLGGRR